MNNKIDYNEEPIIVSIRCTAYNQEKFIRETLEGFIMQKTNFRFEAIVHDDASTDNTADIIREYAEKYPDIIKPIYETENQYSKKDGSLLRIMNEASKGKYITMCEGDDYWTDPYKLQKQVDFLEAHPDYVLCSHRYQEFYQNSCSLGNILPRGINNDFTFDLNYYILRENWVTQPLTCMYRASAFDSDYYMKFKNKKDLVYFYVLLKKGKGVLLNDCMGVYRIHEKGVWSGLSLNDKFISELQTTKGIYDVEQNLTAASMLKFFLQRNCKMFNLQIMKSESKLILSVWGIIVKYFKAEGIILIMHQLHIKMKLQNLWNKTISIGKL
jgi:glycosyltransferase involved in cell wall biosynthesis